MFNTLNESVFEDTAPFDEMAILNANYDYLMSTLDLCGIDIKYSTEADAKIQEECCPQEPFIAYNSKPSVPLICINTQPTIACFEITVPVYPDNSVKNLLIRVAKEIKNKGKYFAILLKLANHLFFRFKNTIFSLC